VRSLVKGLKLLTLQQGLNSGLLPTVDFFCFFFLIAWRLVRSSFLIACFNYMWYRQIVSQSRIQYRQWLQHGHDLGLKIRKKAIGLKIRKAAKHLSMHDSFPL